MNREMVDSVGDRAIVSVMVVFAWQCYVLKDRETGSVGINGRIVAVEIDVASKTAASNSLSD